MLRKNMFCPLCRKPLAIRRRKISVVRSVPHIRRYSWCKDCGIGWTFHEVQFCKGIEPIPTEAERAMLKEKRTLERKLQRLDARLGKS